MMTERQIIQNETSPELDIDQELEVSPERQSGLVGSYRPWSPTPSGSPVDNPLVRQRFFDIQQAELKMVDYGKKDLEFAKMSSLVDVAYRMRLQTRITKDSESRFSVLFPNAHIPEELIRKDELGTSLQHESMFFMKERGMKSKELGKVTHLYGGHALTYVDEMYKETMNYLNDLETVSIALKENCWDCLSEDDFYYTKDADTLAMMAETLIDKRNNDSVIDVELMNRPKDAYYRIAARDWTAPGNKSGIIMLKRKHRLGRIGNAEIVMRTSFMVNLDEFSSKIDTKVLRKIKGFEYDNDWNDKILSDKTGLVPEINRLGLTEDPYSFILISTTIYAKDAAVEQEILDLELVKEKVKNSPTHLKKVKIK